MNTVKKVYKRAKARCPVDDCKKIVNFESMLTHMELCHAEEIESVPSIIAEERTAHLSYIYLVTYSVKVPDLHFEKEWYGKTLESLTE